MDASFSSLSSWHPIYHPQKGKVPGLTKWGTLRSPPTMSHADTINKYDLDRIRYYQYLSSLANDTSKPHISTSDELFHSRSQLDTFPYTNWYRDHLNRDQPTVSRRLGGYAPQIHFYPFITLTTEELEEYEPRACYQYPYDTVKPITKDRKRTWHPVHSFLGCEGCSSGQCAFTKKIVHPP
jgi:hypothetical protein